MNCLTAIADSENRKYITPEDVTSALYGDNTEDTVRLDLLEIIANQTDYGIEDMGLCAFVAWHGVEEEAEE